MTRTRVGALVVVAAFGLAGCFLSDNFPHYQLIVVNQTGSSLYLNLTGAYLDRTDRHSGDPDSMTVVIPGDGVAVSTPWINTTYCGRDCGVKERASFFDLSCGPVASVEVTGDHEITIQADGLPVTRPADLGSFSGPAALAIERRCSR